MNSYRRRIILLVLLGLAIPAAAHAFMKDGCGSGECKDCHALTRDEAIAVLATMVDNVVAVSESPVRGLFAVDVVKGSQKVPIYVDFSKSYVISGQVFEFATRRNLTGERFEAMNRPASATIPLDDTIVVGSENAPRRVIVFTNPTCPYCIKLHGELLKVSAARPDVAFYLKILSGSDPTSRETARAIICSRSLKTLEAAYEGNAVPPAAAFCPPDAAEKVVKLAASLGVRSTPVLIMPDGTSRPGYQDAETIVRLLDEGAKAPAAAKEGAAR